MDDNFKAAAFAELEKAGEDEVRLKLASGTMSPLWNSAAQAWLGQIDQDARAREAASASLDMEYKSRQANANDRAASAAERSAVSAEESVRIAKIANRTAIASVIIATISVIVSAFSIWVSLRS